MVLTQYYANKGGEARENEEGSYSRAVVVSSFLNTPSVRNNKRKTSPRLSLFSFLPGLLLPANGLRAADSVQ